MPVTDFLERNAKLYPNEVALVELNPDEKSWDCPCHGSRFDYKGNLIDNPAQEDLCHD